MKLLRQKRKKQGRVDGAFGPGIVLSGWVEEHRLRDLTTLRSGKRNNQLTDQGAMSMCIMRVIMVAAFFVFYFSIPGVVRAGDSSILTGSEYPDTIMYGNIWSVCWVEEPGQGWIRVASEIGNGICYEIDFWGYYYNYHNTWSSAPSSSSYYWRLFGDPSNGDGSSDGDGGDEPDEIFPAEEAVGYGSCTAEISTGEDCVLCYSTGTCDYYISNDNGDYFDWPSTAKMKIYGDYSSGDATGGSDEITGWVNVDKLYGCGGTDYIYG